MEPSLEHGPEGVRDAHPIAQVCTLIRFAGARFFQSPWRTVLSTEIPYCTRSA
jgi:hypothetical protein